MTPVYWLTVPEGSVEVEILRTDLVFRKCKAFLKEVVRVILSNSDRPKRLFLVAYLERSNIS